MFLLLLLLLLALNRLLLIFCVFFSSVDSSGQSNRRGGPVTLTCHLSDTSEVTHYDWVREVPSDSGGGGVQSVGVVKRGKILNVSNVSNALWTCQYYGKKGLLGNVTYYTPQMSKLFILKTYMLISL